MRGDQMSVRRSSLALATVVAMQVGCATEVEVPLVEPVAMAEPSERPSLVATHGRISEAWMRGRVIAFYGILTDVEGPAPLRWTPPGSPEGYRIYGVGLETTEPEGVALALLKLSGELGEPPFVAGTTMRTRLEEGTDAYLVSCAGPSVREVPGELRSRRLTLSIEDGPRPGTLRVAFRGEQEFGDMAGGFVYAH